MIARVRAALVAALVMASTNSAWAQTVDSAPPVRHILAIDFGRIKPFQRSYDIVVHSADSARIIGRRDVSLEEVTAADSVAAWMLVEMRTGGVVNSADTILLSQDLRPLRWRSVLGVATLDAVFSTDSMSGTMRVGSAGGRVALAIPPDLVLSTAELELLAVLLPLAPAWSDSVNALAMTFGGASVEASELAVAEDSVADATGLPARPAWVVSMRAGAKESRVWVDRETGDVLRAQQLLPSQVGAVLEYRIRFQSTMAP